MKPLNYAILKYFTKVNEASVSDVIEALKGEYGSFKALNQKSITEALMTAEANGLLSESRFELDEQKNLVVYYTAPKDGADTINKYIPD